MKISKPNCKWFKKVVSVGLKKFTNKKPLYSLLTIKF